MTTSDWQGFLAVVGLLCFGIMLLDIPRRGGRR
jgi:hypothetical protein